MKNIFFYWYWLKAQNSHQQHIKKKRIKCAQHTTTTENAVVEQNIMKQN